MSEKVINEDEMIGYILRKTSIEHNLNYEEVQAVLDAEIDFLREKGIVEDGDTPER